MTEILMKHVFCALWMALFAPLSMANAAPLDASDARFQEVVDIWLSGQEMEALQSLADMAREGHGSAKILLSRIASHPQFSDHIKDNLDRKARIALFREPKGLSGRDWTASASEVDNLAKAIWGFENYKPGDSLDYRTILSTLVEAGEIRIAMAFLLGQRSQQRSTYTVFALQMLQNNADAFGPAGQSMAYFLMSTIHLGGGTPPIPADVKTEADLRAYIASLRSSLNGFASSGLYDSKDNRYLTPDSPRNRQRLSDAVRALPELQPLTLFCEVTCSETQQNTCLAEVSFAMARTGAFPFPVASPAQSLIDDTTYWSSDRMLGDVERMAKTGQWQDCR